MSFFIPHTQYCWTLVSAMVRAVVRKNFLNEKPASLRYIATLFFIFVPVELCFSVLYKIFCHGL